MSESMFDKLARQRQQPASSQPQLQQKRQRKITGKRSNPDYIQVGAYLPKDLNKAVKRKLIDYDGDFSDLVAELLETWVDRQID